MTDPAAKLDEYLAHRRERERRLLAALEDGLRSERRAARRACGPTRPRRCARRGRVTLVAHLEKLDEEGRLPADVERPELETMFQV